MASLRDESTPEGRAIWTAVDEAAARAPEWARRAVEKWFKEMEDRQCHE